VSGEQLTFIQPVPRRELCAVAADAGLKMDRWRRAGLMPRPRKLVFRGLLNSLAVRLGRAPFEPGNFGLRRAIATLLSLLPGASSHYFITLMPDSASIASRKGRLR
jgi:hypothetical protein